MVLKSNAHKMLAYDTVIVRYGEIFLKSDYVRRRFEDRLMDNIRRILARNNIKARFVVKRHRLYLKTDEAEEAAVKIARIFGVSSASPAVEAPLDEVSSIALKLAEEKIKKGESFAVRVKRTGEHDFKSKDIEAEVGRIIKEKLENPVNLENPDRTIHIEVRDRQCFIHDKIIRGVGGLPYSTQGKVAAILSDEKSAAAAWMMMRRGCELVLVCSEVCEDSLSKVKSALEDYSGCEIKSHQVFAESKKPLFEAAEKIAEKEGALGIVSGETMTGGLPEDLHSIDSRIRMPIYRPLVGLTDEEISNILKKNLFY